MVTVLCETSHAAARCRQFARLEDPVSRPLISLWQKASLQAPVLVLHTWHDCKLKGVHGRAWKRWLAALPQPRICRLKSSTTLPRAPFCDAVPTSVITEALRGHPWRCAEICRSTSYTYLNLCLSLEEVLAC